MINVLTASGYIGKDAYTKTTQSGKTIYMFSLPITSGYGDHKKTTWATCKMFGRFGEAMYPHLKKGKLVTVSGEVELNEWENQNGKQSMLVISVNQLMMGKDSQPQQQRPQEPAHQSAHSHGVLAGQEDFDDDIPF